MPNQILPYYAFLPWVRKGIAKEITDQEAPGELNRKERTLVDVKLNLHGDGGSGNVNDDAPKTIQITGPGDIKGISADAIIRTEPAPNSVDFEPNYLACIEFYDVDFPWRYTPATADNDGRLRPWLFLIVLKDGEYEFEEPKSGQLPSIKILDGSAPSPAQAHFLPNANETSAWAHVQLTDSIGHSDPNILANNDLDPTNAAHLNTAIANFNQSIQGNNNLGISRIISPRKLEEKTKYRAFLVPTYETGRRIGLGADPKDANNPLDQIPAQKSAWGAAHAADDYENRFPIYYDWSFSTGEKGDFEALVKEIKPRTLDNRVGRKPMDIQNPGFGLSYQIDLDPGPDDQIKTTLSLEGALKAPGTTSEAYPYADREDGINYNPSVLPNFRKQLEHLVNLNEDQKEDGALPSNDFGGATVLVNGNNVKDDPIISPPAYGRWQAGQTRVNADDTSTTDGKAGWLHELNLDPRNRVIANVGSSVMREKQEQYMDLVWGQLGEVLEANKKINWGQLAKEANKASYQKSVAPLNDDKVWEVTGSAKRKMKNSTDASTQYKNVQNSILPVASGDRALRRIKRARGPVMKKVDPTQQINGTGDNLVQKLSVGTIAGAPAKEAPLDAVTTLHTQMDAAVQAALTADTTMSFAIANIGQNATASNNTQTLQMVNILSDFSTYFSASNWVPEAAESSYPLATEATDIVGKVDPELTLPARVLNHIKANGQSLPAANGLNPIYAYPKINKPMYEEIRDLNPDLLIPNLQYVPSNTVSLLETNTKFIESFMVGLNHEMSRELLWREYPTDQRGTYFRQFWNTVDNVNVDNLSDADYLEANYTIKEIHQWNPDSATSSKLGENGMTNLDDNLVLLLRANLLRKYPNTLIYMVKADWQRDGNVARYDLPRVPLDGTEKYPIFSGTVDPDITFLGFEVTEPEAKGVLDPAELEPHDGSSAEADPGYFFVLKERVGQSRFGIDEDTGNMGSIVTWDDLHWGKFETAVDGSISLGDFTANPSNKKVANFDKDIVWDPNINSAEMAMVLYQKPLMVSIHAREMLGGA